MKKTMLTAVAASAILLTGCGTKEEEAAPADATPAAEASADTGTSSEAAASDAGTATDAGTASTGSPNQGTSGGPNG